jgi:hypothetical protein
MMVKGFGAGRAAIRFLPKRFDTTKIQCGPSGGQAEMIRPILEEGQLVREAAAGFGVRERMASKMAGLPQSGRTMRASQRLIKG